MGDPLSDFFLDDPRKLDDPFADLAWLREHHPVHRHEPIAEWFVFPYEDVRRLLADPRLSSNRWPASSMRRLQPSGTNY